MLWLPLLGAAYSRARESTCDRHGLACCASPQGAARALAALSAGAERWKDLNLAAYLGQAKQSSGFWMSFHELTASYPWLTKRVARVVDSEAPLPKRNGFAYLLALFIPYAGRLGGGFGFLILIYVIGILAAVAIPAYQDFGIRAKLSTAIAGSQSARTALGEAYQATRKIPPSLESLGIHSQLPDGTRLILDPSRMVLTVSTKDGDIIYTPRTDASGAVIWACSGGAGLKPTHLPPTCHGN